MSVRIYASILAYYKGTVYESPLVMTFWFSDHYLHTDRLDLQHHYGLHRQCLCGVAKKATHCLYHN